MTPTSSKRLLTAKLVESVKPESYRFRIGDTMCPNLKLVVHPTGRKVWTWRGQVEGKAKTFTLGRFPSHTLADAREWGNALHRNRDAGVDLIAEKAAEAEREARLKERTCDWLFERYMENEGNAAKSVKEKWRLYRREVSPALGSRSIYSIAHNDLANLLQAKLVHSASVSNHLQALIRRWFRWSVTLGRHISEMEIDPAANLVKLAKPQSRDRFLDDYEICLLLRVLAAGDSKFADPIRLILYTGVRRAEAFELRWAELADLSDGGKLILPGSRTKNGQELVLPLPSEIIEMLRAVPRRRGQQLVWPGSGDENKPMSGFSKAVAAFNAKMIALAATDGRTVAPWTLHDLRRSVASGMNGLHDGDHKPLISYIVIERILNHVQPGVQAVYNRWGYMAEKKAALRLWADHLAMLASGARP